MRKFGFVGIVIAAALACTTFAAATASAGYDSEVETTTLGGIQLEPFAMATAVGSFTCKGATLEGTQKGGFVESGVYTSESVVIHQALSDCTFLGGVVPISTAGCDYRLISPVLKQASTSIECEKGAAIRFELPSPFSCKVEIPGQTPSGQVSFESSGAGQNRYVIWKFEITGIAYSWEGKSCPNFGSKPGSTSNGTFKGSTEVLGANEASERVGIWVT
jgi:hypothetical protein